MIDSAAARCKLRHGADPTVREAIREELLRGAAPARAISERVSIPEKDLAGHLEHLERSLRARGERLVIQPASCIAC